MRAIFANHEGGPDLRAKAGRDGEKTLHPGFLAYDDPLEAAVFSVLVEIMKELEAFGLVTSTQRCWRWIG